jgi:23S rRNA (adenine2503-C2)-methyltransferase
MSDFNKDLRRKLVSIAKIQPPKIYEEYVSSEGTIKYLIELDSGSMVEMVVIPEKKKKNSLCFLSSWMCTAMYFLCNWSAGI